MNYTALTQAIKDYTENTETSFVDHIDDFIRQAEQRIYNSVQLPALRKNSTGTTSSSNSYMQTPDDFLAPYSLAVINSSVHTYLLNKDVNWLREAYSNASTTGLPKYYALFDEDTFILAPTPDSTYSMELHYYYYPTSIVTASTTFLGDDFDSALLNGALIEAIRFQKGEPDVIANYEKLYLQSLTLLQNVSEVRNVTDSYRSGANKVSVGG